MNKSLFLREKVLCITQSYCLTYAKGFLNVYSSDAKELMSKYKIENRVKSTRFFSRLLRSEPRCAAFVDDKTAIISHNGRILLFDIDNNCISVEHYYEKGMKNPLQFCVVNENNVDVEVYYGEYIWNSEKGPVAIYKRFNRRWEKVFEFPAGTVTHIHNIVYDELRDCFFISTGDTDKESGIWIADHAFKTVRPLLIGKQKFRACVVFPTEYGFIYATDTPLEDNYIFKVVMNESRVAQIEKMYRIPGPSIYGVSKGGLFLFATSVEPDSSLPGWRYRITYKLGKGVMDRYAHIIAVNESGSVLFDYAEKKDFWPIWLFQFGNFQFPYNTTSELLATTQALRCGHSVTIKVGN